MTSSGGWRRSTQAVVMGTGSTNPGSRLPPSIIRDGQSRLRSGELCWKKSLSRELKSKEASEIGFNVGCKILRGRLGAGPTIWEKFLRFSEVGRHRRMRPLDSLARRSHARYTV